MNGETHAAGGWLQRHEKKMRDVDRRKERGKNPLRSV